MDPNANLQRQRELLAELRESADSERKGEWGGALDTDHLLTELAELTAAMDQ